MIQSNQNEQLIKIGNWVSSRLNKFESILTFVFLLAMALKMGTQWDVNILLAFTLIALANLYFLNAFSVNENAGGLEIFFHKLTSIGCSISVIGVLFRIERWAGYDFMIILGCITLIISLAGILYLKLKKQNVNVLDNRLIIRIITILAVGLIMLLKTNAPLNEALV